MANRLNIYACTGIGNSGAQGVMRGVNYELFGTNTLTNTQAVNSLLSRVNYNVAILQAGKLSKKETIDAYNELDLYNLCLNYAYLLADKPDELAKAGNVIGTMQKTGAFSYNLTNEVKREEHYARLVDEAEQRLASDNYKSDNAEFAAWWQENVIALNKRYYNAEQANVAESAIKDSIRSVGAVYDGWKNDTDLSQLLTKGSEYFIYLYFTDEQLAQLPDVFREKKVKQLAIYNACKDKFVPVYGTEADLQRIIQAGIILYNDGKTPKQICKQIVESPRENAIGVLGADDIVAIVIAVISAIVAIITAICESIARSNEAKYAALDEKFVEEGAADESDFLGFKMNSKAKKYLLYLLGGVAAWFVLKR